MSLMGEHGDVECSRTRWEVESVTSQGKGGNRAEKEGAAWTEVRREDIEATEQTDC